MPITSPVPINAGPAVPSSSTPEATFDAQYEAFNAWERDQLQPGANALATNVFDNATAAAASAVTAADKVTLAANQVTLATEQKDLAVAKAVLTAADRVQTGLDRTAASDSAISSEASRIAASKLTLGNKATEPTVDNQGAALLAGATYYDTVLNKWRVWTGAAWGDGLSAVAGVSSVNGATGAITNIATTAANTFTGAQNTARATVASHATTADIWAAAGNQIDWTGTATTTAFPNAPQAGAERTLICAAACSFTASANMLIDGVVSAATVTCEANDKIIVMAITTTQFMLSRIKADGTAQVAAGSNGGATTISSAVSITLTAASSRVQAVTMTASALAVTLPNATTLTTGGPLYVISNTGTITFRINAATGAMKTGLGAGMTAAFYCTDISTSASV